MFPKTGMFPFKEGFYIINMPFDKFKRFPNKGLFPFYGFPFYGGLLTVIIKLNEVSDPLGSPVLTFFSIFSSFDLVFFLIAQFSTISI